MPLNTRRTGQTHVAAVRAAVTEQLARLDREEEHQRHSRRGRLQAIARHTAPRLAGTPASTDIGSYLYDGNGLPA